MSDVAFKSGIELEEAMIEYRALLQSYLDLAGETCPPLLFTLEKGLDRLDDAFKAHQKVLHQALKVE